MKQETEIINQPCSIFKSPDGNGIKQGFNNAIVRYINQMEKANAASSHPIRTF
jgi:hypothetical protein